jgi:thiol-disulfide isomerase/thioredoxin
MKYAKVRYIWPAAITISMGLVQSLSRSAEQSPHQESGEEVSIQLVKYSQLVSAIKSLAGKVIVVDVWADFCIPCKKEFPNLVQLHRRYAKDGLSCISVSVDEPQRKDAALKFLRAQHATFANYLLDEEPTVWQEKWDLKGVPAVFVFDRQGKLARKFDDDDPDHQFTYADVEKLAQKLLQSR